MQHQERRLKQQVDEAKSELKEKDFNIESMNVYIREPAVIGRSKTVCGHCHHRGHRNQATKPCILNKCSDYGYCGIKEKHPEYFAKLNTLKLERRKKENAISELENQIKSIEQFSSTSEFQFVKNLTPRMYNIDPTYKTNKCKLMQDVRLLREALDGKIPPVTVNDAEQLGILIAKLRKTKAIADDDSFKHFDVSEGASLDGNYSEEETLNASAVGSKKSTGSKRSIDLDCKLDSESMHSSSSNTSSSEDEVDFSRKKHKRKHRTKNRNRSKKKSKSKRSKGNTIENMSTTQAYLVL